MAETLHGALLILELAAPGDEIAGRQFHRRVDFLLRLGDEAADVAVGHVALDDDAPLCHFAADLRRAFGDVDLGELAERNERAARRRNENFLDRLDIVARCFGKTHGEAENFQAFINLARFLAADGGLDHVLNVGDVDAVARDLVAVDFDLQIGQAADFLDVDVGRAAHSCRARARRLRLSVSARRGRRRKS